MGQPDQTTPVESAPRDQKPSRTGGGRLSTLRRYLGRAATSGALSAATGATMLLRAALALRRGDRVRGIGRGLLAGGWLAAAAAQRRTGRRARRDDVGPVGVTHPEGERSTVREGETGAASGDALTERGGPSDTASGAGSDRQGADDADQSDVVGQDVEPVELGGMTDESEESPESDDHGAVSSGESDGTDREEDT